MLESALNLGLIRVADVQDIVASIPEERRGFLSLLNRAESGSETRVRLFLQRRHVTVSPQVYLPGIGRVDLLVGRRLIVECDSAEYHSSPEQRRLDYARDLAARDQGFDHLRLDYHQIWHQWGSTQESLLREIRRDRHRRPPR
nr:hypothetical protein [Tessaracoccus palaemonis]